MFVNHSNLNLSTSKCSILMSIMNKSTLSPIYTGRLFNPSTIHGCYSLRFHFTINNYSSDKVLISLCVDLNHRYYLNIYESLVNDNYYSVLKELIVIYGKFLFESETPIKIRSLQFGKNIRFNRRKHRPHKFPIRTNKKNNFQVLWLVDNSLYLNWNNKWLVFNYLHKSQYKFDRSTYHFTKDIFIKYNDWLVYHLLLYFGQLSKAQRKYYLPLEIICIILKLSRLPIKITKS
jgi:hypothetical protein